MPNAALERPIVIDCHCHTFNAKDIPTYGFLKKVILNADEDLLPRLAIPLARLLTRLTEQTPGGDEELRKINKLLAQAGAVAESLEGVIGLAVGQAEDDEPNDEQLLEELRVAIKDLEKSEKSEHQELFSAIKDEVKKPETEVTVEVFPFDLAEAIWDGGGVVARYVKWIRLLTKYRYKVTRHLIDTYTSNGEVVDLFTPALVDYDRWVDDRARTDLPTQIQLMEGNIRLNRGRIHPYFPFDPWRESQAPGTPKGSLYWLKKAVANHGFIGAKLYPPMGYSATGNFEHSRFPIVASIEPTVFGEQLDSALDGLYEYCESEEVPILTHCADSNETEEDFGKRADPKYWEKVVDQHRNLRVCLGHFGGLGTLSHQNGWAWHVGRLLNDQTKNVYADISHYTKILDDDGRGKTIDGLRLLFEKYPNAMDRILFGTDWIMLARAKNNEKFLVAFRDGYEQAFGYEARVKFMGLNAAKFLGLQQGGKTRERLNAFYKKYNMEEPTWAVRI